MNRTRTLTFLSFSLLTAWLFGFCKTATQKSTTDSPFLNVRDSVAYIGMATCRSCHANIHETFIQTGMGRSFDKATRKKSAAAFDTHAVVYDTLNNFYYYPFFANDSTLNVLEYRLEKGDTTHKRLERISYIVGSGQHTNSHILDINGYAYQAPVTWYTQEKRWDLAPGFRQNNSRFSRLLADECITCHNHYPEMVPGSINKFSKMPTGIECERCHGPGKLHAEEMLKGNRVDTATATDYTIVNPRKLPRDLQMDLCQRCHLQGVAVLEEGKTFFDFKPGMKLNSVMNVFLPRYTDSHEQFIMASQADRLRMSECFKNSPELSCLTCHNPHKSIEVTPAGQYNNACKKCHSEQSCPKLAEAGAPLTAAPSPPASKNCSACHMPKSGSMDIPHVHITDHRIAIPLQQSASGSQDKAFLGIQILTKENPTPLDMARGYLATFDKYIPSTVMLDSAAYYLGKSSEPSELKFKTLVHLLFSQEKYDELMVQAAIWPGGKPLDGWTAYRIGEAFFNNSQYEKALTYFQIATKAYPFHLDFLEKEGAALISLNRLDEGTSVLEKVIAENPERSVALTNLGFACAVKGDLGKAEKLYDRAIALDPDYEQALVNKAAVCLFQKRQAEAITLLKRVLKINPDNQQALEGMARINVGG
ncbi:MAG: tetratricopeptide repeat protein [Lewinellaceae bacterium]|nr:tetratricopeptide repeat protein [Saprospiraceae bacterium]MCB9337752.1 tetratricopeptide repeat protein [Lewinellaceae bacterium]